MAREINAMDKYGKSPLIKTLKVTIHCFKLFINKIYHDFVAKFFATY